MGHRKREQYIILGVKKLKQRDSFVYLGGANLKKEKPLRCDLDIGVGVQLKKGKGKFLCSAVSNPQDCSKRFTLYSLADLFNQTPSQLI